MRRCTQLSDSYSVAFFLHVMLLINIVPSRFFVHSFSIQYPLLSPHYCINNHHKVGGIINHSSTIRMGLNAFFSYSKMNNRHHSTITRLFANLSYRQERKEVAKRQGKNSKELDWEHYEFSQK